MSTKRIRDCSLWKSKIKHTHRKKKWQNAETDFNYGNDRKPSLRQHRQTASRSITFAAAFLKRFMQQKVTDKQIVT